MIGERDTEEAKRFDSDIGLDPARRVTASLYEQKVAAT